ncbi:sulfotransferase [Celeribacter neptunius]|uniref:Sulfotransferase family protein n=1 Tax=Celeribacter neptunius TaxID=588602 RepID=A0A1I3QIU9_9RHOB|nr:sulfotransferase [Celeribacter neptunius]SFJ34054.1 hypothetical protein SAMN04487991_1856 [Celeribacter neptunius]
MIVVTGGENGEGLMQSEARQAKPMVIQIGFNRCGTLSFHEMMSKSGYKSLHWQDDDKQVLAERMITNLSLGRAPFHGYEKVQVFSDIAHLSGRVFIAGARFFRSLHEAYPEAYFLFNTRDRGDWIASRAAHGEGGYLRRFCKLTGATEAEVFAAWGAYYDLHSREVMDYFTTRDARFLRFELGQDGPEKIADWLAPDFIVDIGFWRRKNRNRQSEVLRRQLDLD